ncbi:MAG: hypothetical protein ACREFY_18290 [Acetobacteraceae bacterium]
MGTIADTTPIEGQRLERWAVMPGGTGIRLDFLAADGTPQRIVLSFDALSGLLMTLPRMLQSALDARCADGSLRVVQPLGRWRIEQPAGCAGLILKLATPDGFEIAFAVDGHHAGSLGAALLTAPRETHPAPTRRPH